MKAKGKFTGSYENNTQQLYNKCISDHFIDDKIDN